MLSPSGLLALGIVPLSAWALSQSLASIANISIYEKKAEKVADWSNAAKTRLWNTRYTVGAGFVACTSSLAWGISYLIFASGWTLFLAFALMGTARYMRNFWAATAKVPLLDQYNAAIKQSLDVVFLLQMLSAGWGVVTLLRLIGL